MFLSVKIDELRWRKTTCQYGNIKRSHLNLSIIGSLNYFIFHLLHHKCPPVSHHSDVLPCTVLQQILSLEFNYFAILEIEVLLARVRGFPPTYIYSEGSWNIVMTFLFSRRYLLNLATGYFQLHLLVIWALL